MENICAVVVTYNRKKLLLECLQALLQQTRLPQAIYLVDNASTDHTTETLQEMGYLPLSGQPNSIINHTIVVTDQEKPVRIHYIQLPENIGGAGGFQYGMQAAFDLGYDSVWILDDDGFPEPSTLAELIQHNLPSSVKCSLVVAKDDPSVLSFGLRIKKHSYYTVKEVLPLANEQKILPSPSGNFFNSILIPRSILEIVGFPRADFFIWGDEMEYYFRILSHHFPIVTVCTSQHHHPRNASNQAVGWKYYYMVRNSIFLIKKYPQYFEVPLRSLVKVLIFQSWCRKNTKYILRGLWDGLLGKTGSQVRP